MRRFRARKLLEKLAIEQKLGTQLAPPADSVNKS